jgi:hypothetical protein
MATSSLADSVVLCIPLQVHEWLQVLSSTNFNVSNNKGWENILPSDVLSGITVMTGMYLHLWHKISVLQRQEVHLCQV